MGFVKVLLDLSFTRVKLTGFRITAQKQINGILEQINTFSWNLWDFKSRKLNKNLRPLIHSISKYKSEKRNGEYLSHYVAPTLLHTTIPELTQVHTRSRANR